MLDQIPLQLDREGIKETEDGERGEGGRLFEGGDYFKYYHQGGAIIRGRRLMEGRLLFEEVRYPYLPNALFNGLRRRSNIVNFMSLVMISDLHMSCMTVVEI